MRRIIKAALACAGLLAFASQAFADTTWDTIKNSDVLRNCVIKAGQPYSFTNDKGEWEGLSVDMGNDLAQMMGVKVAYQETTWGTAVLDLQSNKCDVVFGLNASPNRWEAVDFAGPLWKFNYMIVLGKDWKGGQSWADFDKPDVTLAVIRGADETAVNKYTPNAKKLVFADFSEVVLAVQSHRADALVTTALLAVSAVAKNPDLGTLIQVNPEYGLPAYAAMRKEDDRRFRDYVNHWAEYNRDLGNIGIWVKKSLASLGVEASKIPSSVNF